MLMAVLTDIQRQSRARDAEPT